MGSGHVVLADVDQWARCAFDGTSLSAEGVELSWSERPEPEPAGRACPRAAGVAPDPGPAAPTVDAPSVAAGGLAFDPWCRAYVSRPHLGRVDVLDLSTTTGPTGDDHGPLHRPTGLAVDVRGRLYVVQAGGVLVVDLADGRVLRRLPVAGARDVARDCGRAVLLCSGERDRLVELDGGRPPRPGPALVAPRCPAGLRPDRVAPGPLVLWREPDGTAAVVATADGDVVAEVPGATDLDVGPSGELVVSRGPRAPVRRFRRGSGGGWTEREPLAATRFDGGAVAVAPNGRVAFTTATGIATTAGPAVRRGRTGTVTTYRLDSGAHRTRWGRVFLDACVPAGTSVGLRFLTVDDDAALDGAPLLERTAPERGTRPVAHPEASPPMPVAALLDDAPPATGMHRRAGSTDTWEAPVVAPPGRFLWIQIQLSGTGRVSPRVGALRVEAPGHALLASLPRRWSRSEPDAAYVHRFLAPAAGLLAELDARAAARDRLVDPAAVPADLLGWLARIVGTALDARWPEAARRTLLAEAFPLFARRGTLAAVTRILEIYLGAPPAIVEQWRARGLGGAVLGTARSGPSAPAVGGAARASGTLGRVAVGGSTVDGGTYADAAHRFCVLVPGQLTDEQRAVVTAVLDVHRPAHTRYTLNELGPGMRVGQELRVRVSSYVGPSGALTPAVLGREVLGSDGVVGRPAAGSRLGRTSIAGQVRVG